MTCNLKEVGKYIRKGSKFQLNPGETGALVNGVVLNTKIPITVSKNSLKLSERSVNEQN